MIDLDDLKYDLQALTLKYGASFGGKLILTEVPGTPEMTLEFEIGGKGTVWIIEKIAPTTIRSLILSFGKGTKFDWKIEGQENGARVEIVKSQDEDILVDWCERRGLDVSVQS